MQKLRPSADHLLSIAVFAVLAVVLIWPVPRDFSTALAVGVEPAPTVPLFNLWTLWWNCDRWNQGLSGYWDAPIFYPETGAFAFSEPQPLTGLVAWLLSHVLPSLTACYHTILLINLTLNGWIAMRLLRRLRMSRLTAYFGGACVAALPLVHWQLGVLQLTALWPAIWGMQSLRLALRNPNWKRGAMLGLALATTYLTCHYYALMLVTLWIGTAWILLRPSILKRQIAALVVGAAVSATLILPIAWHELSYLKDRQLSQSRDFVLSLSLSPRAYAQTPWAQWLSPPISNLGEDGSRWGASPGTIKMALAVLGFGSGFWRRPLRRWTIFILALTGIAVLLSLGTRLKWGEWVPFEYLIRFVPGFRYFRSPFRFALFAQLGLAFAAAQGIDFLARRTVAWFQALRRRKSRRPTDSILRYAVIMALGSCAVLEAWPPQTKRFSTSVLQTRPDWAVWVERSTPPDAIFAFLPFPGGTLPEHYRPTVEWMCWQMVHHRRMVNGYSGLFPKSYLDLNQQMANFPAPSALEQLSTQGVDYCVVVGTLNERLANSAEIQARQLVKVYSDAQLSLSIYRLGK